MVKSSLLEICCPNAIAVELAAEAEVERIELCEDLSCGGITPSEELVRFALSKAFKTHILIRPRGGNFVYTPEEIAIQLASIQQMLALGVHGVVVGAANADHSLDIEALKAFKAAAGTHTIYCHRVFDAVPNKMIALESLMDLGYNGVLTSGGEGKAIDFCASLKELIALAKNNFCVLIGGGVRAENIVALQNTTGGKAFHSAVGDEKNVEAYRTALQQLKQNIQ
jgi:copper homeostasis protein